uniref:Transmembrane protein 255B n=1 Tax=Lates calcarifer TaxID=8187 RepID=A0A4W6D8I8_LATCA
SGRLLQQTVGCELNIQLVFTAADLVVGLISATRTDNVPVAGYYPGITMSFGAFLGIVGIYLVENRRPMLMAAIIFISIGVIASFFCAIVDGIIASEFIDTRPLQEDMCDFYASGAGYAYDSYYTEVTCRSFDKACKLKLRSNTCYCCYLYNCESTEYHTQYYEFTGVSSCWDAIHLYRLLWASVVLNVIGLFLGIITAAILGAYKDMQKPTPPTVPSPAPPPHILYNPTQHMLTYAGFCPSGQTLPAYPNYPIPMQVGARNKTKKEQFSEKCKKLTDVPFSCYNLYVWFHWNDLLGHLNRTEILLMLLITLCLT